MQATFISNLIPHVVFSFEPEGLLYISFSMRCDNSNDMIFYYSRLDKNYSKKYKIDEALSTPVFVYESSNNIFLSKQPKDTVFEFNVCKREVLTEKAGIFLKKEFKRMQNDPVYFYMKYCNIRTV